MWAGEIKITNNIVLFFQEQIKSAVRKKFEILSRKIRQRLLVYILQENSISFFLLQNFTFNEMVYSSFLCKYL